jgi:hypothetical protein
MMYREPYPNADKETLTLSAIPRELLFRDHLYRKGTLSFSGQ